MFYYIEDKNIIYKSKENIQQPPFSFDKVIQSDFEEDDLVIYFKWEIILYYGSELYKEHNWLKEIENNNTKLKEKLENQEKIVNNVVMSYETIKTERKLLIANRRKAQWLKG